MFQKLAIGLCCLYLSCAALAQTSLSGIVNRYAAVTAVDHCQNSATITDAAGFEAGMTVLLIQMKGATINTGNTAAFGDITDIGQTGRFEKATLASLSGNTVFFQNALLNSYHTGGNVQLVYVPVYENAVVSNTLSAAPWNGQTGGILALEVTGTLTLQADLDVSGQGFRGGLADITAQNNCSWLVAINGYAYGPNDWRGAAKGEGIAAFVASQQTGRGAQANGGGGGNDHNAGGGGGGNTSAGGKGGNNDEPSFFGCDGFFPGRGGKAAPANPDRCYLGGGGGAGHENNSVGTDGGNGGGILMLKTSQLVANGHALRANGAVAASTFGEGAGGGGAGGTLLLEVSNLTGALLLEARGGNGGNIDNVGAERCSGPGGGGAGGRILFNPAITSVITDVLGGAAGIGSNSASCATGPNDAQPGNTGATGMLISIPQGSEPNLPPAIAEVPAMWNACSGDLLTIPLQVQGFGLTYRWQLDAGAGFADLQDGAAYSGTGSPVLQISNVASIMDGYVFRLRVSSACFPTIFSQEITLEVPPIPQAAFSFTSTDLMVSFTNNASSASTYWWDFGDGQSSAAANPQHLYAAGGDYLVVFAAITACDTAYAEMLISVFSAPVAGFSAENTQGCTPHTVLFSNQSTGVYTNLLWLFPGGDPVSSGLENPTVAYLLPGVYEVTLIASGPSLSDTLTLPAFVSVLPQPIPDFSFQIAGNQVSFTNMSVNATTYNWDFGDGAGSPATDPEHTFAATGVYSVTLNAQNAWCGNAVSQTLFIGPNATEEGITKGRIRVFPNPTGDILFIKTNDNQSLIHYTIQTQQGMELKRSALLPGVPLNLDQFPAGTYHLQIRQGAIRQTISVIKH